MSGHTPRRLKVHHDHGWLVISDDTDDLYIKVAKGLGASVDKDNARRLVACWNACDGISTDELETTGGAAVGWTRTASKLIHATTQRDELLEALGGLLNMLVLLIFIANTLRVSHPSNATQRRTTTPTTPATPR